jgi:putative tryptophan/tyrosine transport system substrate-binding protein
MSYSSDLDAAYRDVIVLMAKILKGRNPADLPVQLPIKVSAERESENCQALTRPPTLLTRADEVIE